MPARRISTKQRRNRDRSAFPADGKHLRVVLKAIETERDNLSRAESLLGCLQIAMEYGEMNHKDPYYPDVAEIARRMVRKSISALDPIHLPNPPRKVKEEFSAKDCVRPAVRLHEIPLMPQPAFRLERPRPPRLHHRSYSRALARNASNINSASANISG
jgi:hypothetical protein